MSDAGVDRIQRRLERERQARRDAEEIAERVTRELFEANGRLTEAKSVLDETTDFVAITDIEGHPSYVNRSMHEAFGLSSGPESCLFELLTPTSRERFECDAFPSLQDKGIWRGEFALGGTDGREVPVSLVMVAHLRTDGKMISLSCIGRDMTEQQAMQDQLAQLALHDPLTGLPNRRLYFERLDLARARAQRNQSTLAVFFIDLDSFKAINDSFGHEAGDAVLFTVAGRIEASLRATDTLARVGGDEFVVLCEDVQGEAEAGQVASRLLEHASAPIAWNGTHVSVTLSIGIAISPGGRAEAEDLMREADAAMYQAKASGKAQAVITTTHPS